MAYVQGSKRPGGKYIRDFDRQMFALGYHVTSGYRCSGSFHGCGPVPEGAASDYGDSVNDLRAQWLTAWPHRHRIAEMLGPWGLYRYGRRFYNAALQAQHRDHNHFAVTRKVTLVAPLAGYTASESRWIREYDRLLRAKRDLGRRRVLRRVMTAQRKRVWRAAQGPGGWGAHRRSARYASLKARTT